MKAKKAAPSQKIPAGGRSSSVEETTVVSWGLIERTPGTSLKDKDTYVFPPGLFGVKQISAGSLGVVFLKKDGTLSCWDLRSAQGGRTQWHRHLETLQGIDWICASFLGGDRLGNKNFCHGLYTRTQDGEMLFHYLDYTDVKDWFADRPRFKSLKLGKEIVEILLSNDWNEDGVDLAVSKSRQLIPVGLDQKAFSEKNSTLSDFVHGFNQSHKADSWDWVHGCLLAEADGNPIGLFWNDTHGKLYHHASPSSKMAAIKFPRNLPPVHGLAASGGQIIVLSEGKLFVLNPREGTIGPVPEHGSLKVLEGPIQKIHSIEPRGDFVVILDKSGRAGLVSASTPTDFKPKYRVFTSKPWVSPSEYLLEDAWFLLDEVRPVGLGVAKISTPEKESFQAQTASGRESTYGTLRVWGQENDSENAVKVTEVPMEVGKVVDAELYSSGYNSKGWICIRQNGSLHIQDPYPNYACADFDYVPPWFPDDFVAIKIDQGFVATRASGVTIRWGPSHLKPGKSKTVEDLQQEPALRPPADLGKPIKLCVLGELACAITEETSPFNDFLCLLRGKQLLEEEKKIFFAVTRGHALLEQAIGWWHHGYPDGPRAGKEGPAQIHRGLQWRLCMAWAGFETWILGILFIKEKKLDIQKLQIFAKDLKVNFSLIPPDSRKGFPKWINEEGGTEILGFLGVNEFDQKALGDWLIQGKEISDWGRLVALAKALRNATVHGSLSASKVEELGLTDALKDIPSLLRDLATFVLRCYLETKQGAKP